MMHGQKNIKLNEHRVTEVLKITQTAFQIYQNWITPS